MMATAEALHAPAGYLRSAAEAAVATPGVRP